MRPSKERLTIDPESTTAGERDEELALLAAVVADYEHEFGEITADEIDARQRTDREDRSDRGRRT